MDNQDQHVEIRIRNILDSKPEIQTRYRLLHKGGPVAPRFGDTLGEPRAHVAAMTYLRAP